MPTSQQPTQKKNLGQFANVLIFLALFWVAVGFGIKYFLSGARMFSIPSGAMSPTLRKGDYIVADMNAYKHKTPERGDVVVFLVKGDPDLIYTMRIIGLPGDRIQMRDGKVVLNDQTVPQKSTDKFLDPYALGGKATQVPQNIEMLPSGREYPVLDQTSKGSLDNTDVFNIPEGHYFVMGDNRDNSADSRLPGHIGMIPHDRILGRMSMIYWSRDVSRIGTRIK